MFSKSLLVNFFLLAIVLLGGGYTWHQLMQPIYVLDKANQPDSYATGVTLVHIDKTGVLCNRLETPLLVHYGTEEDTLFSDPVFTFYKKNKELWKLSASFGKLKEKQALLYLWDNVVLKQYLATKNEPATKLITTNLLVSLKKNSAETTAPVTVTQPNQILHAVGLRANFTHKTIQFLSDIRTEIEPRIS